MAQPILAAFLAITIMVGCDESGKKDKPGDSGKENEKKETPKEEAKTPAADSSILTIAAVRPAADGKGTEVLFNERAAVYTIPADGKTSIENANNALKLNSADVNAVVKMFNSGNTVTNLVMATGAETERYNALNKERLKSLVAPTAIDVSKIDTSTFNRVSTLKKYNPVFALCNSTVPNYAKLVEMFNYCASQGCNNPGPYAIPNCITFQYVIDGCYARAHKMRQMLSQKFGYCCEKVFSFANSGNATLAVKADKWGGCCVQWWYHVAPLFRVNVKFGGFSYQICYVIDPGMFNTPVTLSTWLQAQKNTACNTSANVSMYSIQPGTAYWPTNYAGTTFGTDPNLTNTEATLIAYKNLKTCP